VRVAVVLFDGAEELDWAGPWEVLAAWAQVARIHSPERAREVRRYVQYDPEPPV